MECGFKLWGQDPATATVKIMGYGSVAMGAIRCAARKLAKVEILNKKNFLEMEKHIPGTDILVDGIYHTSCWGWPGLEPKEIAKRYSLQVAPILRDIANKGLDKCPPDQVCCLVSGK